MLDDKIIKPRFHYGDSETTLMEEFDIETYVDDESVEDEDENVLSDIDLGLVTTGFDI